MKKTITAAGLLIAVCCILLGSCAGKAKEASPSDGAGDRLPALQPQDSQTNENQSQSNGSETNILILVNNGSKLPEGFAPNLAEQGILIDKAAFDDFVKLREAARSEKIYLMVDSAYRTASEQEKMYQELGAGVAARPGYSEHQTGLAIDFSYQGQSAADTNRMWGWLSENAYKYGFILRYPQGKEAITGFSYEPWHYRYVGVEHAVNIQAQGYTLEEYLSKIDIQ
ncbi:MAG: M15 family metallopeptidase [Eubacteriaceae bacterium]|nr:M15 family metallopeptidase [Eubacteriaceae bacterium]